MRSVYHLSLPLTKRSNMSMIEALDILCLLNIQILDFERIVDYKASHTLNEFDCIKIFKRISCKTYVHYSINGMKKTMSANKD